MGLRERWWVAVAVSCVWILPALLWGYLYRQEYRQTAGLDPISSFPYAHTRERVTWLIVACLCVAGLYWIGEGVAWMRVRRGVGKGGRS
jgi:hypothetical protein